MSIQGNGGSNFLYSGVFSFVVVGILAFFWPSMIAPFRFFEFWTIKGSILEAVKNAWPIYAWGTSVTALITLFGSGRRCQKDAREILVGGTIISITAGLLEEICFRWLIFFLAIVMIPVGDWLLLGFAGLH